MIAWLIANKIELFGVISGLIYLVLEIKQKPAMWVVGFFSTATFVVIFFQFKIYAQMALNIYYVFVSIYGLWLWMRRDKKHQRPIVQTCRIRKKQIFVYTLSAIILFALLCFLLRTFTDSETPYFDAFVSSLGVIGTWMLAKKILEQWFVWIVVNISSVILFSLNGLYLTTGLYIVYTVLSVYGYFQWKKQLD